MLSIGLLVAHIAVTVLDGFVDISLAGALLPFPADYEPVWTGLGTVAALLLVTAAVTAAPAASCRPLWRRTHFLTHLAWPVAVVHGSGVGTDARRRRRCPDAGLRRSGDLRDRAPLLRPP